ncbi:unnamed protein product, partial [Linum tenue]
VSARWSGGRDPLHHNLKVHTEDVSRTAARSGSCCRSSGWRSRSVTWRWTWGSGTSCRRLSAAAAAEGSSRRGFSSEGSTLGELMRSPSCTNRGS